MKTIRLKKRSLNDQIALLRMEITLLQQRVQYLEMHQRPQYIGAGQIYHVPSVAEPYPGYPRPDVGGPWPGQQSPITVSAPFISGIFGLPEEKA